MLMGLLRRFVRYCFGFESLLLGSGVLMTAIAIVRRTSNPESGPMARGPGFLLLGVCELALLIVPGIAWWTLRQEKHSARSWAIAGGVLNRILFAVLIFGVFLTGFRNLPLLVIIA